MRDFARRERLTSQCNESRVKSSKYFEMGFRGEIRVRVFRDGSEVCALIGRDLGEGIAGFGTTPSDALRALAEQLEKEAQSTASRAA